MKILYGVQGTGNGHITRARVMAKAFAERDIDVDYLFSGRPVDKYFDMEVFGNYRCFEGLTFVTEQGKVNTWKTAKNLHLWQLFKDIKSLDISQYDLILTDFEPITAWAATLHKKFNNSKELTVKIQGANQQLMVQAPPVINISHQACFTFKSVPTTGSNWFHRQLLKHFVPADVNLGVHWYHFGETILPPFIEPIAAPIKHSDDSFILVYLPFEDLAEIVELLNSQHDKNFVVFHPDVQEEKEFAAVKQCKLGREAFLTALANCSGVIANAGFELSSEALTLGKKLLLKPLQGQFEQASNVLTLTDLGLASSMEQLDEDAIEYWLQEVSNDPINYPSDPAPLIDWLLAGDYSKPNDLCEQVWQSVSKMPFQRSQRNNYVPVF
ncbi:MAG: glycosyltransferase [Gammaproteobacteria bacterium]|nr:glycosyltransferase [Gammaproteobacteria bacterium]